ncbi:hypothetical protein MIND_00481900 [Mycena indigotica]|uniref:Uncharacterized protein n=1 Tax=Mycena indigotica TaxID=2126181 RepID=A0A8H6WC21_9AGAR|nr:uncharacterized protein MIND_00481900 [Mycena indigotica]KAF7306894.1 hypothetical protein MIND_00481900 [Mycena indigotica]
MSNVRSLIAKYDVVDSTLPPSPARFIPRRSTPSNFATSVASSTLIDDLSRHSDDEDEPEIHKHPPQSPIRHSHVPIAATAVFARNAPPLSLPRLDHYLSQLKPPDFAANQTSDAAMFPPMEQLAKTGSTIEDLELNLYPCAMVA